MRPGHSSVLAAFLARGLRAGFSAAAGAASAGSALGLRPRLAGAASGAAAASALGFRPRLAGAFSGAGSASAFALRVDHAQEGDLIAVIGKGHETYRDREGVKTPFLERELLEEYAQQIGLE